MTARTFKMAYWPWLLPLMFVVGADPSMSWGRPSSLGQGNGWNRPSHE